MFWINPKTPEDPHRGERRRGARSPSTAGRAGARRTTSRTGQFYHANLDEQFPFHIYGAQQDRSSYEGSSAAPKGVWTTVRGGEMSWVVPEPGKPWITFASGYYSDEYRGDRRTGHSTLVSAWPEYKFGAGGKDIKYRFGWNHHAALFDPHNPNAFLMGANVVLETLDEGVHWKAISPDLTRDDKTQAAPAGRADRQGRDGRGDVRHAVVDRLLSAGRQRHLDRLRRRPGVRDHERRRALDAGAAAGTARRGPPITCIEPSHTDAGTAYVSASRFDWDDFHPYVYKTTDYGKTWTALTTGLPQDEYVESVRQDPDDPSLMFAATSRTVYDSQDGGRQWQPLTLNLPAVRVNDIEIQPEQHAVVLATFGRGVLGPRRPAVPRAAGRRPTWRATGPTCTSRSRPG